MSIIKQIETNMCLDMFDVSKHQYMFNQNVNAMSLFVLKICFMKLFRNQTLENSVLWFDSEWLLFPQLFSIICDFCLIYRFVINRYL